MCGPERVGWRSAAFDELLAQSAIEEGDRLCNCGLLTLLESHLVEDMIGVFNHTRVA